MKHTSRIFSVLIVIAFLTQALCPLAEAGDKFTFIVEKQEEKRNRRWSLQEWLDTRDRMRMMDLWLHLHSPSPYEFYFGGNYKTGSTDAGPYYGGWDVFLAGYAYLFGIEMQRKFSGITDQWLGLVNFRLFGTYNQATNLTVQGGVRHENRGGTDFYNPLLGAHLTLYLTKAMGVEGLYRYTFSRTAPNGIAGHTNRWEAGAFIDFNFVRIFGDYFKETESGNPYYSYSGVQLGTRIYLQ